jgi:signal transduction histidine kinase
LVKEYYNEDALTEKEMELLEQLSYSVSRSIERKTLEEERKLYTEKLKELNNTKDQFFSIISHDLRSPFDSILGFTEILKNEYNELSDNEIKLFIDSLFQASRHIYSLLNNLLQFSRFQLGKMEFEPQNLPLYNIVEKNIEILKGNALKKQINLINKVKAGFVVFADKEMLNSIILNLVTNAIKFTGRGGDVIISSVNNDKFVEVSVVDTGIGMDKKTLVDLFKLDVKKSTPGTENESGTGLGLMLTKEFVENNGGKITVKSSPNKGTCFSFTLPLAKSG